MRELDSILDSFLSKGYEACSSERDVVELHREHGVCIKIKKEFNTYSVKMLLHSQVKMMGTIARKLLQETMEAVGQGVITNTSHSNSHVEIKVSGTGLTYRKLESYVDIFYTKFHESYLQLIQSAQMRMYHMESKNESYDTLSRTSNTVGEYRDTSHEGRVHSDPNVTYTKDYTKDYTTSTGTSSTYSDYNTTYRDRENSKKLGGFIKGFFICFIAFFIIAFVIAIFIPSEYDINGYYFDSFDYVADGDVEEYDDAYGYGTTFSGNYAYMYVYNLRYEGGTLYTEVVNDINKYVVYLKTDFGFQDTWDTAYWELSGETYETHYSIRLDNGDIIHFGIADYYYDYSYSCYVDVVFVYEELIPVNL